MGNSSTINIAALLFGITKDQKDSIDSNTGRKTENLKKK